MPRPSPPRVARRRGAPREGAARGPLEGPAGRVAEPRPRRRDGRLRAPRGRDLPVRRAAGRLAARRAATCPACSGWPASSRRCSASTAPSPSSSRTTPGPASRSRRRTAAGSSSARRSASLALLGAVQLVSAARLRPRLRVSLGGRGAAPRRAWPPSGPLGLTAIGTLFAAVAVRTRYREVMLPLLLLPLLVPVMLGAVRATDGGCWRSSRSPGPRSGCCW